MNETNSKINEAIRGAWNGGQTFVASDQHKALNAEIRSKANAGVTVGGTTAQEAPQAATAPHTAQSGTESAPQRPTAPPGNAGAGAYVATEQRRPTMNDAIRGARYGKPRNIVNRYLQNGAEVKN